jgi:isoaspartyl peptidase/L-asparaginase-like protein (Ntn-hydrolase superfamily)
MTEKRKRNTRPRSTGASPPAIAVLERWRFSALDAVEAAVRRLEDARVQRRARGGVHL